MVGAFILAIIHALAAGRQAGTTHAVCRSFRFQILPDRALSTSNLICAFALTIDLKRTASMAAQTSTPFSYEAEEHSGKLMECS